MLLEEELDELLDDELLDEDEELLDEDEEELLDDELLDDDPPLDDVPPQAVNATEMKPTAIACDSGTALGKSVLSVILFPYMKLLLLSEKKAELGLSCPLPAVV